MYTLTEGTGRSEAYQAYLRPAGGVLPIGGHKGSLLSLLRFRKKFEKVTVVVVYNRD